VPEGDAAASPPHAQWLSTGFPLCREVPEWLPGMALGEGGMLGGYVAIPADSTRLH